MKVICYKVYDEVEGQRIYTGIPEIEGGWIATTNGDPLTRPDLEEAEDYEYLELIESLISGVFVPECESRDVREADEEDIEYVQDWLETWCVL